MKLKSEIANNADADVEVKTLAQDFDVTLSHLNQDKDEVSPTKTYGSREAFQSDSDIYWKTFEEKMKLDEAKVKEAIKDKLDSSYHVDIDSRFDRGMASFGGGGINMKTKTSHIDGLFRGDRQIDLSATTVEISNAIIYSGGSVFFRDIAEFSCKDSYIISSELRLVNSCVDMLDFGNCVIVGDVYGLGDCYK